MNKDAGAWAPTLLEVRGLTRRFGKLLVLDDVSFDLAPGEICAVTGANGAGKTTLLRCVVGADRPDAGTVSLGGRRLDETEPCARAAVASVLDDVAFFADLSVAEHLELLAYAYGGAPSRVTELLGQLSLDAARDQLPATLSSGQRRRLSLASALVRPCRLLVLDEPEQHLDDAGRHWLTDQLIRMKADDIAVLFAAHDRDLISAAADTELALGVS